MAPFITSPSRLILRIGVLIAASILIPYALNLSYDWLENEYEAPPGAIFVILIQLLLAAVLVIAAPLKVSRTYWIYVALAALVTTAVLIFSGRYMCFSLPFPFGTGGGCPWWYELAFVIPPSVVAPLSFCTAVYFGRNERVISVMPRRTKLFLVIMVLSILVSVLLWHRGANDDYGRPVSLYDADSSTDTCPPLKTSLTAADIDMITCLVSLESDGEIISWELGSWIEPEIKASGEKCQRSQELTVYVSAAGPLFVKSVDLIVGNGYWRLKNEDDIARQLRQAAMSEDNQVLREKLWIEYRNYRKATEGVERPAERFSQCVASTG